MLHKEDVVPPAAQEHQFKSAKAAGHTSPDTGYNQTHFHTVIIAAASEDMTNQDMMTWIGPLLDGMAKQSWYACVFDLATDGTVSAQLRTSFSKTFPAIHILWLEESASEFRKFVPSTEGLLVILLSDCVSQVFTLLDAVADWLCIVETNQPEVRDLCQLVEGFTGAERR